jgi:hypothetical protein
MRAPAPNWVKAKELLAGSLFSLRRIHVILFLS